jgi:GT2 family glycosyltransferase
VESNSQNPTISVGLVTYNSVATLELCLKSILRNPHPSFEIIVVDNHSTDGSLALAHELLKDSGRPFHLVARGLNNLSEARNNVIEVAHGDLIAFTDPDCEVPEHWLGLLQAELTRQPEDVAGVGGSNRPSSQHWLTPLFDAMGLSIFGHFGSSQISQTPDLRSCDQISTCNSMFRKSALLKVSGFSPLKHNFGEDLDLNYKLRRQGYRVLFNGRISVVHHLPVSLKPWLGKCFNYGRSQVPALARNGWTISSMRLIPAIVLPLIILATLMQPMFFLVLAVLHLSIAILICGSPYTGVVFVLTQWAYLLGYVFGGLESLLRRRLLLLSRT